MRKRRVQVGWTDRTGAAQTRVFWIKTQMIGVSKKYRKPASSRWRGHTSGDGRAHRLTTTNSQICTTGTHAQGAHIRDQGIRTHPWHDRLRRFLRSGLRTLPEKQHQPERTRDIATVFEGCFAAPLRPPSPRDASQRGRQPRARFRTVKKSGKSEAARPKARTLSPHRSRHRGRGPEGGDGCWQHLTIHIPTQAPRKISLRATSRRKTRTLITERHSLGLITRAIGMSVNQTRSSGKNPPSGRNPPADNLQDGTRK